MSPFLQNILTTLVNAAWSETLAEALDNALHNGEPEGRTDEQAFGLVARRLEELRQQEAELLHAESLAPLANDCDDLPF